jgi:carboxylesterase
LALESDSAPRIGGSGSGGPLPTEEKERERAVRPATIRHALTAWELETTRGQRPDTPRARASLLRAHQKLRAELEERRGIPPVDRSIMLGGEEGADAVLLLHGATSTPAEMRPLAEAIHAAGFSVYAPLLPTRANLAPGLGDVLWRACLQEARLRLRFLREVGPRVHVVGLGFGSAIAIHLAGEEKPQGVVLLAPALEPRLPLFVRLLLRLNVHRLQWVRRKYGWSLEVLEAMERARPLLSRLDMPVYAAQCQDDERIAAVSLRMVQRKARHRASRFRLYPQGGHRILQIHGPAGLHAEIVDFLREI